MLKTTIVAVALALAASISCQAVSECNIDRKNIVLIGSAPPLNSYYKSESVDPSSEELVTTEFLVFPNGDQATVEQKYCDMYNLEISYLIKNIIDSKQNQIALGNIEKILSTLKPSVKYKKTLNAIIEDTIAQYKIDTSKGFSFGLSADNISVNDSAEHQISLTPIKDSNLYSATYNYYIGIGGM